MAIFRLYMKYVLSSYTLSYFLQIECVNKPKIIVTDAT